ncbi:hypothetical protein ABTY96_42915 [Streptomyces sp. NPDC096057]
MSGRRTAPPGYTGACRRWDRIAAARAADDEQSPDDAWIDQGVDLGSQ